MWSALLYATNWHEYFMISATEKMQHGNGIQVITRVKHMRNSLKRTKTCWIVPYFVWCIIMHRVIWKECICKHLPQSWDVDGKWRGRCCWSRSCSHWDPTGGNMVNQVNVEGIGVYTSRDFYIIACLIVCLFIFMILKRSGQACA